VASSRRLPAEARRAKAGGSKSDEFGVKLPRKRASEQLKADSRQLIASR
jgi:hypothetical protein